MTTKHVLKVCPIYVEQKQLFWPTLAWFDLSGVFYNLKLTAAFFKNVKVDIWRYKKVKEKGGGGGGRRGRWPWWQRKKEEEDEEENDDEEDNDEEEYKE